MNAQTEYALYLEQAVRDNLLSEAEAQEWRTHHKPSGAVYYVSQLAKLRALVEGRRLNGRPLTWQEQAKPLGITTYDAWWLWSRLPMTRDKWKKERTLLVYTKKGLPELLRLGLARAEYDGRGLSAVRRMKYEECTG